MRLALRAAAVAALLATAAPALAQTEPGQTDQPAPAQTDQPAPQAGQRHHLSPEMREAMRKACGADIQSYCTDADGGHAHLRRCLRQNFDKLSGECRTQLKEMRAQWRRQDQPQQPQ